MNPNPSNVNDFVSIKNGTIPLSRTTAFWAGFFYILTFVSIPTLSLYQPIREPDFLLSNANYHKVVIGGILEIIVALSGIITAVILYTVFRKHNQTLAIGLISSRIVEAGTIFVGVAFLLGALNLHQQAPETSSIPIARALVVMYDRIFVLGQGFMPAINDLLLGTMLYQTRLVPRWLSLIGIIGAFPLFAGFFSIMFGVMERTSPLAGVSAIMVAFFEFSFGIYLLVKAVKKS